MNFLYYRTLVNVLSCHAKALYLRSTMVAQQARNQLETLREWSVFCASLKIFELSPTVLNYMQHIYLWGAKIFSGGVRPLLSSSYGSVAKHDWLNTMMP